MAALFGKMRTTWVRRLTSAFKRSSGRVEAIFLRWPVWRSYLPGHDRIGVRESR